MLRAALTQKGAWVLILFIFLSDLKKKLKMDQSQAVTCQWSLRTV